MTTPLTLCSLQNEQSGVFTLIRALPLCILQVSESQSFTDGKQEKQICFEEDGQAVWAHRCRKRTFKTSGYSQQTIRPLLFFRRRQKTFDLFFQMEF